MASLNKNSTIKDWQEFNQKVYGYSNDRDFSFMDMVFNVLRFTMRGLKGIRKKDGQKTKINFFIAMSWYISLMNQLHFEIDEIVWARFPAVCSYCGQAPCVCKEQKIKTRQKIKINNKLRPKTFHDYQIMFAKIYPTNMRTMENAGIHLAEEMGELSEAMLAYRGNHEKQDFAKIPLEAADMFSCFMGVFNSLGVDVSEELAKMFYNNCHECHKNPCECNFGHMLNYRS